MGEGIEGKTYRVHVDEDCEVVCPICNTVMYPEDEKSYEFIDLDENCCGDVFSVIIKCLRCGSLL